MNGRKQPTKSNAVKVDDVNVRSLTAQGAQDKLATRLYTPAALQGQASGLIVFFPYGGFLTVELEDADGFARALAACTGYRVLTASYTTAPQSPFPAAVEDAYAVLKWVGRSRARLGWDGKRLMTAGIEAGGNLAAVSALVARDRGGPDLHAQILIMPMLDPGLTTCSMRSVAEQGGAARAADACAAGYRDYLPRALDRTHPYVCPIQSSRMKGLPPALILSADEDPLRDEAEQYGAKLAIAGIRTTVRRLPPIELETPDARCSCAHKGTVLHEIAAFIAGLEGLEQGL